MPSINSPGANPLGQIWLEGAAQGDRAREFQVNTQLEREKMGNQYAIAQMETETRRQALQQQAQMAQMELDAKQQELQQQMAMKSQELNFEKAYRDAQIGLGESEQSLAQKKYQFEVDKAADVARGRLEFQREFDSLVASGYSTQEAAQVAAARKGLGADIGDSAMRGVIEGGGGGAGASIPAEFQYGQAYDVPGLPSHKFARTGANQGQYIEVGKSEPRVAQVPFDSTKGVYGTRVMDRPQEREAVRLEKDVAEIRKMMNSANWQAKLQSVEKAKDPKAELTLGDKSRIQEWKTQQEELKRKLDQIDELRRFMREHPVSGQTNAPSAGSTNRVGRFNVIAR